MSSVSFLSVVPKIDRSTMIDIKVKAGQNFEYDVAVSGEPPPRKEWYLKENIVLNTDRVKVSNEDYSTRLKVIDSKRSDSGTYTLTAKNQYGSDTAEVRVVVLGKCSSFIFLIFHM